MTGISRNSNVTFGTQIVPIKSEKPITPQEQADLAQVKALLDEKMGPDVIDFKMKDANSVDVIINHPDPKVEKEIAAKMQEMAGSANPQTAVAPKAASNSKNLNFVA